MTSRALRSNAKSGITCGVMVLVAACGFTPRDSGDPVQGHRVQQRFGTARIVQTGFGSAASYSACTEPACPIITRKTLATAQSGALVPAASASSPQHPVPKFAGVGAQPGRIAAKKNDSGAGRPERRLIIQFALGSAVLAPSATTPIERALPDIANARHVLIQGRTDDSGDAVANRSLALARANAVRDYVRRRIPTLAVPIEIDAQGHCCFAAANDTPEGRRKNRRSEIVIDVPEQVAP